MKTQIWIIPRVFSMLFSMVFSLLMISACAPASDSSLSDRPPLDRSPSIELLTATGQSDLGLPFSEAVRYGDLLFLSGQIGSKPGELKLVAGGIGAETRQTMINIADTLERHGSSMDKVLKCTVFMANMDEWAEMNVAYIEAFGTHRPARSALGASGLALGGSVEIECIAGT